MPVVTFNYGLWSLVYPEFNETVSQDQADYLFTYEAGNFLDNTEASPVLNMNTRLGLLNMLVAHIAQLRYGSSQQAAGPLVGRIASATEGSVSVSAAMEGAPGSAAWFNQTKYGAAFFQSTMTLRSATWVGPAPERFDGFAGGFGGYDTNFYG